MPSVNAILSELRQSRGATIEAGLPIRLIGVRPPERREVPTEVQFEVARNTVTDIADLGTDACAPGNASNGKNKSIARLELRQLSASRTD